MREKSLWVHTAHSYLEIEYVAFTLCEAFEMANVRRRYAFMWLYFYEHIYNSVQTRKNRKLAPNEIPNY